MTTEHRILGARGVFGIIWHLFVIAFLVVPHPFDILAVYTLVIRLITRAST